MTWFDGQGYKPHGARSMMAFDAGAAAIAAALLLLIVPRLWQSPEPLKVAAAVSAGDPA